MLKDFKVFGISWFDVKTKIKKTVRSMFYSDFFQELISTLIFLYVKLVYHTSRVNYLHQDFLLDRVSGNQAVILSFWHHRLVMMPFVTYAIRKANPNYRSAALSSNHGDGGLLAKILIKFGLINIHGSSRHGRKASRGINLANFKKIFQVLKENSNLVITPDGPRGPSQKINGEIINIAKISGVPILPVSCSVSKYFRLNSWDRLIIPLPFSNICYAFDDLIWVGKDDDKEQLNQLLETKMNLACKKADESVKVSI